MPKFLYLAADAQGRQARGEIEATSFEDARNSLASRGLQAIEIVEATSAEATLPPRLSSQEAEEVVVAIAELSDSELPLAEGLRAAAAESSNARVAHALRHLATDVEQGYALETSVQERGQYLPPHVRGLIAAATRANRLGLALDDLVEHHRVLRETRAQVLASLAYPTLVFGAALLIAACLPIYFVPTFKEMFEEFDLELPAITQFVIRLSDGLAWFTVGPGKWFALAMALGFVVFAVVTSLGRGTAWSQRLATSMPLLGPMWQWSGAAAFSRLLATLIDNQVPLAEALRLAADGVPDADIRLTAGWLSRQVEQGRSLADAMRDNGQLPMSMVPLVRWGERTDQLGEALRTSSDIFLSRVRMRALLLRSISPPVVFLIVGLLVGFFVLAMMMPMVSLIQGLS